MASSPKTDPGTDVATQAVVGDIVSRNEQTMQTFIDWCVERASGTDDDTMSTMQAILADILESDNIADALRESAPLSAENLVGVPLLVHSFELREGDHEDSLIGFYAALTVQRVGAEGTRVVTCGGMKVLARLKKIEDFDAFPALVNFTAKKTKKGNTVLDLVTPEGM